MSPHRMSSLPVSTFPALLSCLCASLALLAPGCGSADDGGDATGPVASDIPTGVALTISEGKIRGVVEGPVRVFRGIPYAAPPVGPNRFRAPQPPIPWTDERDATSFGSTCTQVGILSGATDPKSGEDCLFLNVWTPEPAPTSPRPVIFWVHGGAFIVGSGSQADYDATLLAQTTGAVVVTINYRLGPLGFLGHAALAAEDPSHATGTYGLQDQQEALRWVKRNIHVFGGDPQNVALAGESAGGFSVSAHLVAPSSRGLFQRAMVQSGPLARAMIPDVTEAGDQAAALGKALGCTGTDAALVACLREKPAADVTAGLKNAMPPPGGLFEGSARTALWFPIFDGGFFPKQPSDLLEAGDVAKVPLIIGSTEKEGALFHAGLLGDVPVKTQAEYDAALTRAFGAGAATVAAKYPVAAGGSYDDALAQIETDAVFGCPSRAVARKLTALGVPVYRYMWRRPVDSGALAGMGAAHSTDIAFLFGNSSTLAKVGGEGQPLVTATMGYWAQHALAGDPNGAGRPTWPRYDTATDAHLVMDLPPAAGTMFRAGECDFWDAQPPIRIPRTY